MNAAISARNLSKKYGKQTAIDGIDLSKDFAA